MSTVQTTPISILAAIDYSDTSSLAVQEAVEMARQKNAGQLHFLHVSHLLADDNDGREARRTELLDWLSARLQGAEGVPHTVKVVGHEASGDPARVIVEMANDLVVDVVVVGTHSRKGVQRALMGSVAEWVVRHCGCPVLVVRNKLDQHPVPQIEPPCPRCVEARVTSQGAKLWCEQHSEKHGRRHTYYNTRLSTWVTERMIS
jgi:nucleotide-binding universal stress UspA family protein